MKPRLFPILLMALMARPVSLAQQTPSPSPTPSPGFPGNSSPTPMPGPNIDYNRLQRLIDQERMNTPEPAAKPSTVPEIEKTLADNRRSGDGKLAAILTGLTLTERANAARLSRWKSQAPGPQSRQVLLALADGSTFLPLPAEDVPAIPAPSQAEQRRMITASAHFLGKNLPSLPNFRATLLTTYFEDRPPRQLPLSTDPTQSDPLRNRPLHVVGTSAIKVAYVEGHEVIEKNSGFVDANPDASRFTTAGEFGTILYGVMLDAVQNELAWARWESSAGSPLAVFRFDPPKEQSHYSLKPHGVTKLQNQLVAYRGEIAIDPADGAIVWLSVIAAADIAVEYGRVEIGQRFYTCPVHGVALSKVPLSPARAAKQDQPVPLQTQLNDVSFQQFHAFRGDPHITQETAAQP